MKPKIYYVFDTMCGWSYGTSDFKTIAMIWIITIMTSILIKMTQLVYTVALIIAIILSMFINVPIAIPIVIGSIWIIQNLIYSFEAKKLVLEV